MYKVRHHHKGLDKFEPLQRRAEAKTMEVRSENLLKYPTICRGQVSTYNVPSKYTEKIHASA
jgi:hypothetical protein